MISWPNGKVVKNKVKRYKPPKGAKQKALSDHVSHRATFIREKYSIDSSIVTREQLTEMLGDTDVARFPTDLSFSSTIEEGLFGFCHQKSEHAQEGYTIVLHSDFQPMGDQLAYLVFYLLIRVNYGEFATFKEAELFAAGILGLPVDDYYHTLCELVDKTITITPSVSGGNSCSHGMGEGSCSHQV